MVARHPHALRAAALALLATLLAVTVPLPARAADSDAVPILRTSHPFPHGYMEYDASAGQTITDFFTVVNGGQVAGSFILFAADGLTSQVTGVVYANPANPFPDGPSGNGEYGAGTWITLGQSSVQLASAASSVVSLTVKVPATAAPGDWVGSVSAMNPVPQHSGGQFGFNVTTRVTIAVVVHVAGPLNLDAVSLGTPYITVENHTRQILNIPLQYMGDVLVKPFVDLKLLDARKRVLFSIDRQLDTFVPHTTLIYPVPLDNTRVGPGNYQVVIDFGPTGAEQHFVRNFTVTTGQANVPPPSQRGRPPAGLSPLLWLIALVPLLALILILLLLARRRRRCAHCGRQWSGRRVSVAEVEEVRSCVRCKGSLSRFGSRVRLCPDCFAGHRGWDRSAAHVKVHAAHR
ncbi:MAG: hypothetical protein JOZ75_12170 [Candidatus Dormibacteraeota bacterium]|nr:hypothetical protein [Candidatus Dormibacteraeota bacterium]